MAPKLEEMILARAALVKSTRNAVGANQIRGVATSRPHTSNSFFYQRRQLREHIGHLPPQLFIVPLESGNLLRVHTEGIGMDGHLIEIVGTPPL